MPADEPSPDQVDFIEAEAKAMYAYVNDCIEKARTEGNNTLQWLFAAIGGGTGLGGTLASSGYWALSIGIFCAVGYAAIIAMQLIRGLQSRFLAPPGNLVSNLETMLPDPAHKMRWREARGLDSRIRENRECANKVSEAVDAARRQFTFLPWVFLAASAVAWNVMEWLLRI